MKGESTIAPDGHSSHDEHEYGHPEDTHTPAPLVLGVALLTP